VYTRPYPEVGLRADWAYAELKHRLLIGEFPLNIRLAEERLAAMLDVSRTPVREALHRLHTEGLVRRIVDGGYGPVAPDVDVMRDLYELRFGLEVQALQRPARMGTRHDLVALERLRSEWHSLAEDAAAEARPEFVLLDESFHVALAEAAGNPPLVELLRQVNERIRLVRMQDFLTTERITATITDHLAIVEAVLDGDLVEAEGRFSEHVERSVAVVEERVTRAIARMISGGKT
jgi:DNA-binding GntR family transcriptional regulator